MTDGVRDPDEVIDHLRQSLQDGADWFTALLDAMAAWTLPEETAGGRLYRYFIAGEAFDWILLAERLCGEVRDLIPREPMEALLLRGTLPAATAPDILRERLGGDKHRGYLNYFYGVTVEDALQLANERDVQKRHMSNGNRYQEDFSEEAFVRTYRMPRQTLLTQFRDEMAYPASDAMTLTEHKEFTYWLFKWRLRQSDGAKAASDTRKGLREYQSMVSAAVLRAHPAEEDMSTPLH